MTEWRGWTADNTITTGDRYFYHRRSIRRDNMPTKKTSRIKPKCAFCKKVVKNYRKVSCGFNNLKICNNCHHIFKMIVDETLVKNLEAVRRIYSWISEHKKSLTTKGIKTTRVYEKQKMDTTKKKKKKKAVSVY